MAWMRQPYKPPLTWNGQMCFPVELTLQSFPEGIRLCRRPIDEIKNIAVARQSWANLSLKPGEKIGPSIRADLLDIEVEIEPAGATEFGLAVRGHPIRYSFADGMLTVGSESAALKMRSKTLRLRILVDRPSVEVFADEGQVAFSTVYLEGNTNDDISLMASGGDIHVRSLTSTRLESIWLGRKPAGRAQNE
jgi:sucrose-6-phosphate hydrolase SacC (GH32 family)